jgi:Galactose mutarotase and related enzymes
MLHWISDGPIEVGIESRGAELRNVRDVETGVEYLWQGDTAVWSGRAPLLFPVIGRMRGGRYSYCGRDYSIGFHGFAWDSEFEYSDRGPRSAAFHLREDPATLEAWPFEFLLEVRYSIEGRRIRKEHLLVNTGQGELLYEIGGHEGYNLALRPGERMGDYGIRFPSSSRLRCRLLDSDVMVTKGAKEIALNGGRLDLSMGLFEEDALILDPPPSREAIIEDAKGAPIVSLDLGDFPFLGIWTTARAADSNFVCLEPWSSLPDGSYLGSELGEKEGVRRLAPDGRESLSYSFVVGET